MLRFNQLHAADGFRRLIRSLSLRPSWLLAPRADRTAATHGRVAPHGFHFRAFRSPGHPARLPDVTTAANWEFRRRDFHPLERQLVSLHLPPRLPDSFRRPPRDRRIGDAGDPARALPGPFPAGPGRREEAGPPASPKPRSPVGSVRREAPTPDPPACAAVLPAPRLPGRPRLRNPRPRGLPRLLLVCC